jgi:hypothetical protein
VFEESLTLIEFLCECGQRESVRIEVTGHLVRYEGPVKRDWQHHPCPYRYDPRCIACLRHKRPAVQAFSGRSPGPTPPKRVVES